MAGWHGKGAPIAACMRSFSCNTLFSDVHLSWCVLCHLLGRVQVGEFLLVALAFALPAWNDLMLAAGCINAAALLLYPLVAESGRWLLSQGRIDEAMCILQTVAKHNKSSLPPDLFVDSIQHLQLQGAACKDVADEAGLASGSAQDDCCRSQAAPPAATAGLLQVLRQRRLAFRLGVLLINWFAMYVSYYGITVSSGSIQGST